MIISARRFTLHKEHGGGDSGFWQFSATVLTDLIRNARLNVGSSDAVIVVVEVAVVLLTTPVSRKDQDAEENEEPHGFTTLSPPHK